MAASKQINSPFVIRGARRKYFVTCLLVMQSSWVELSFSQNKPDLANAATDANAATEVYLDLQVCQNSHPTPALYAAILVELVDQDLHVAGQTDHGLPGIELLDCELNDGILALRIQKAGEREPESTQINLIDVPTLARARTAAVALVEWLISLRNEPKNEPAAPPFNAAPLAQTQPSINSSQQPLTGRLGPDLTSPLLDDAPPSSSPERAHLTLETGASLTMISPTLLLLPGAYLRANFPLLPAMHLEFGSIYGHRASSSRLGRSTLNLLLVEGSLVYRPVADDLLRLALVAQWGHAWAHGTSALGIRENTQTAMLAVVRFRLSLRVPVSTHWSVHGLADFGPIVHGAVFTAGGESVFRLQTFAAETSFGVGFSP